MVKLFGKDFGKKDEYVEPARGTGGLGVPGPAAGDDYGDYVDPLSGGAPALPPPSMGAPSAGGEEVSRSIELLSAKLDGLKASMDAINERLNNLEVGLRQRERPVQQAQPQQQSYDPFAQS